MKKFFAMLLALTMMVAFAACGEKFDPAAKSEGVMTYAEYDAAELNTEVVIEAYVQAAQGWWEKDGQGVITVYAQDPDGAYFIYEMACSQADAAKLTKGTKIRVTGYKGTWAGEIEIMDATFEFVNDGTWVAEATDVTALLGKDELIQHQNKLISVKGATVAAANENGEAFLYKWNGAGAEGDDLYFNVVVDGATYTFCVESYLCGLGTEAYEAVRGLKVGDVIDLEGFLYWYNGAQPHITAIKKVG